MDQYAAWSYRRLAGHLGGPTRDDATAVTQFLNALKPSSTAGHTGPEEQLLTLFCDLSLADRSSVVQAALFAMEQAGPPDFHGMAMVKVPDCWHQIFCVVASIGNSKFNEFSEEAIQKMAEHRGAGTTSIWWTFLLRGVEHRSPSMITHDGPLDYGQFGYVVNRIFDRTTPVRHSQS
jgi:hypothetical protein